MGVVATGDFDGAMTSPCVKVCTWSIPNVTRSSIVVVRVPLRLDFGGSGVGNSGVVVYGGAGIASVLTVGVPVPASTSLFASASVVCAIRAPVNVGAVAVGAVGAAGASVTVDDVDAAVAAAVVVGADVDADAAAAVAVVAVAAAVGAGRAVVCAVCSPVSTRSAMIGVVWYLASRSAVKSMVWVSPSISMVWTPSCIGCASDKSACIARAGSASRMYRRALLTFWPVVDAPLLAFRGLICMDLSHLVKFPSKNSCTRILRFWLLIAVLVLDVY